MATEARFAYFFPIWQIALKELKSYFNSNLAWFILFFFCFICGFLGYRAIKVESASDKVVQMIFYYLFGGTAFVACLVSMRLFAEENARGTLELLSTSPLSEGQIVAGKFISSFLFLLTWMVASLPIPLMVVFYGDAHWGQLLSGYIGVILSGSAAIAITMFFSTLTKIQLLAAALGGANVLILNLLGIFARDFSSPTKEIMQEMSFYVHYMDFEKGVMVLRHFVFFLSIIAFYIYISIISLRVRRWR